MILSQKKTIDRSVSCLHYPKFMKGSLVTNLVLILRIFFTLFSQHLDHLSDAKPHYLRLVEDWKRALDENLYVGAILMDLSKAFDCLSHDLIIEKLKAYGLSHWQNIIKGVPQVSILGPLIFYIFMNDIFYFLEKSTLYNYADDNTVSYCHKIY